ncbi:MAG: D-tyrosyl-tRNA(Tyr) deacylase [Hyphomicrobiales bacterium]|nr:D-tyrosyl-tRNA(Tyr) deacylase [Hyphomicrobiales bacterium]MCP5370176.1 D-tyrosyl-tRNA(Tyr) deacylase [Hyphomicrobiales bacterium]
MRALLQRVTEAQVRVDHLDTGVPREDPIESPVGAIGPGLLVLVCAMRGDTDEDVAFLARKVAALRVFADDHGKMNRSLRDTGGGALVVSQFTLAADWRRGNRPGFSAAADPKEGARLYDLFCDALRREGVPVETGTFAAHMHVALVNDGPVTIWMDTRER